MNYFRSYKRLAFEGLTLYYSVLASLTIADTMKRSLYGDVQFNKEFFNVTEKMNTLHANSKIVVNTVERAIYF